MYKALFQFFAWLHNLSYTMVSSLAVRLNGGVHPKHHILNYHAFFLSHVSPTDRVLDVGCGYGEVAVAVAQKAKQVVGIDSDPQKISRAKQAHPHEKITYTLGDVTTYHFDQPFDVIILSNTLEHIEDRLGLLKKLKILAPTFLIRVPLLSRDWLAVYKKEQGIEYRLDKTHFIEYTDELFVDEITKAGLRIEKSYTKFGELYCVVTASS